MMEFMGTVPTPPVPGQKVGSPLQTELMLMFDYKMNAVFT
jgi:hypothetical protein